jgi:catechol 2,3-dioxygenase-like lactoylglutathione lyase family enzyme
VIDHIGMPVRDIARATEFYLKALSPLGISIVMEVSAEEKAPSCSTPTATISRPCATR